MNSLEPDEVHGIVDFVLYTNEFIRDTPATFAFFTTLVVAILIGFRFFLKSIPLWFMKME